MDISKEFMDLFNAANDCLDYELVYKMRKPWVKPTIVEFDFSDKEDIMDSTDG